jgi:hypothetical protein
VTGPTQDPDDASWLEALAGRGGAASDSVSDRQAALLRRALEQRRARLDRDVPVAGESLFQRIAEEVQADQQTEHLAIARNHDPGAEATTADYAQLSTPSVWRHGRTSGHGRALDEKDIEIPDFLRRQGDSPARRYWHRPWAWGIAASMLFATVVTIQMWPGQLHEEDGPVLRGPNVIVQIVPDPESRSAELAAVLKATGTSPRIERTSDGAVVIHVEATPGVLDALASQRLMAQPKDGKIIIRLEKPAVGKP